MADVLHPTGLNISLTHSFQTAFQGGFFIITKKYLSIFINKIMPKLPFLIKLFFTKFYHCDKFKSQTHDGVRKMSNQIRIAKTIGKRILNQRASLRLSQDFLADHLGLTTETINDWETEKTVPFADQLIQLANVLHSDVLWLISGNDECGEFTEPTSIITSNQLNSWSADIGNCRMAISNAMDCMPQELSATGTLTIVYEKLDELQETIYKQADKI